MQILKNILTKVFCKHEYVFSSDFIITRKKMQFGKPAREIKESKHLLTVQCRKCRKTKRLTPFIKEQTSSPLS